MIKLKDSDIVNILPEVFVSDARVQALGYALKKSMQRFLDFCDKTSVYAIVDKLPDKMLDMLAAEMDAPYYDVDLDVDSKRNLVKNSFLWHMQSGTPAAVEDMVAAVFGEGEVKEWFEYGDDPFYFKIKTDALMTETMNEQFTAMLDRVKNARSHIRAIDVHREIQGNTCIGMAALPAYKPPAIMDGFIIQRRTYEDVWTGVGGVIKVHPAAIQDGFAAEGVMIHSELHSGTEAAQAQKQAAIMENLKDHAAQITQTISAGLSAGRIYKNIIKEQEE